MTIDKKVESDNTDMDVMTDWHGGCDCDKEVETKNTDMEIVSDYEVGRDMEFVADNSDEEVETKYIGMEVGDHSKIT